MFRVIKRLMTRRSEQVNSCQETSLIEVIHLIEKFSPIILYQTICMLSFAFLYMFFFFYLALLISLNLCKTNYLYSSLNKEEKKVSATFIKYKNYYLVLQNIYKEQTGAMLVRPFVNHAIKN